MPRKRKADVSSDVEQTKKAKNAVVTKQGKTKAVISKQSKTKAVVSKQGKTKAVVTKQGKTKAVVAKQGKTKAVVTKQGKTPIKTDPKVKPVTKKKKDKGNKTTKASSAPVSNLVLKDLLVDDKWKKSLTSEFEQAYFKTLEDTLAAEYKAGKEIFPPQELIFNALNLTPLDKVKVVILGQDPYHDNGQAMGLSFSVPAGIGVPPSLKNIYKELDRDPKIKGFNIPGHGNLDTWAKQGILLLNATLTVEAHQANSHSKFGWQKFTDSIIRVVSEQCDHVVFILWGGFAQKKEKLIDGGKHSVIKTAHPSPLSFSKFKACNCFSDCDSALKTFGMSAIDWSL